MDDVPALYVIVGHANNLGAWHPAECWQPSKRATVEAVSAFTSEADAWRFLLGDNTDPQHERSMRVAWRVVRFTEEE